MKIAIHDSKEKHFFSDRWIEYCSRNNIPFKVVNAYDNDIINQLNDCDIFMWHHSNYDYRDALFAKQLIYSLETIGIKVFPDFYTTWHFDDKVGQKYLLEAIDAPLVPSYVFYNKKDARKWIESTSFPKVFKLRGGSGSSNVQLVENKHKAKKLIKKAFGKGFSQFDKFNHLKFRYKNFKSGKESFVGVLKGIVRLFIGNKYSNMVPREKGYVYFQDFIPNNKFDIRVIVVGEKAFALKRLVRKNDFRASGSGNIVYNKSEIDERCIQISFNVNEKLKCQSIAFDYVFDENNNPLIVEISYGFDVKAYDPCPGYWDSSLKWNEEKFNPQEWMIENILESL
jgi:glutathione synthase/RimK-type ligase-like ATP-grasp enzyme